jgi:hypothetical protein
MIVTDAKSAPTGTGSSDRIFVGIDISKTRLDVASLPAALSACRCANAFRI